ncbi:MAG: regulatory domain of in-like proprotein convertase [Gemmataceae bacterium]|nr:regulatory domain of in-like proprotein convertase [Gemmataceae bacterium]
MSKKVLSDIFRRWVARGGRLSPVAGRNRSRPRLEEVERREVPATLPAPTLTSTAIISGLQRIPPVPGNPRATDFGSPMIVANPTNPSQEVAVAIGTQYDTSAGNAILSSWLVGEYSNDGGSSWNQFLNTASSFTRLTDPTIDFRNKTRDQIAYNTTYSPTVAFARDGNVYISSVESNQAKTSGALVVNRFDLSSGAPVPVNLDPNGLNDQFIVDNVNVVYRWAGTDPALNPYIAVDNSIGAFTDPETGKTTPGDTMLNNPQLAQAGDPNSSTAGKAVYIVWNTNATTPSISGFSGFNPALFNPNAIVLASSPDRGLTFSTPVLVNNRGYFPGSNVQAQFDAAGNPQIVFSPPRESATSPATGANPGALTVQWTGTQKQELFTSVTAPDADTTGKPAATEPAVVVHQFSSPQFTSDQGPTVNEIAESPAAASGPDLGALTTATTATALAIPVDLTTDPNFFFDPGTLQNGRPLTDLNVSIALTHPNIGQVSVVLVAPDGTRITLVRNRLDGAGNVRSVNGVNLGLNAAPNLGVPTYGFGGGRQSTVPVNGPAVGTVFDDEAPRQINDPNNVAPYIANFQPEGGNLSQFFGMTPAQLSGTWKLEIFDSRNDRINVANNDIPSQFLNFWSLKFVAKQVNSSSPGSPTFGAQQVVTTSVMTGSVDATNAYKPTASPVTGVGAGVSLAYDQTLGSYAPFSGRLYAAYTVPVKDQGGNIIDTNIFLRHSDDNGRTWSAGVRVNNDSAADNFTEGNRTQFLPAVTVDQLTGTVVVTWYDARTDAANARVATFVATSLDGGATFSPQVTLNNNRTVIDAITNKTIVAEPIPTNIPQFAIPSLVGTRASVIASGGKISGFWAGNDNAAGSSVYIGSAVTAAGPRVLSGDMGPVIAGQNTGGTAGIAYDNTFAADGTRQLTGFTVTFDRPIDVSTFTAADIQVLFRSPSTAVGAGTNGVPVALDPTNPITPADPVTPVAGFGASATTFFVKFATPQSAVGTYSYSVGPNIQDRVRHITPAKGSPTTFASTDTPLRVPPTGTAGTTLSVLTIPALTGAPRVGTVTVHIDLTHTFDSDLRFTLIAPDGTTSVVLSNREGGSGHDYTNTTFSDSATIPISAGSPPFTGAFQPETPLAALTGQSVSGTWTLRLDDLALADFGTLFDWSLSFTDQLGAVVSNPSFQPSGLVSGNVMDQNANAVEGETRDAFSVPTPTNGVPFSGPYDPTTLPLIVPGPNVIGSAVPGQPAGTTDNLVLNAGSGAIDVTFDRDIDPATFTAANVLRMTGPAGPISGPFTITPDPAGTPANLAKRVFRISFPPQVVDGTYTLELGPDTQNNYITSANVPRLIATYSAATTTQTVTFDHTVPVGTFTAANVTMTGPTGPVGPVTVVPVTGNPQQYTLTFPAQPAGTYRFDFRSDLTVAGTGSKVDTNLNAGVDVLRGGNPATGATTTTTYTTGVLNALIPANGKVGLTINVPDDYLIQQLINPNSLAGSQLIQVLLNITYPNDPDLTAVLVGPHGERVTLFSGLTGQGQANQNDFTGTRLNDHPLSTPITSARPPYNPAAGAFNPQFPLGTTLNGLSSKGTWTLEITNSGSQTGTLKDFSLTLPHVLSGTGLGESVADRVSLGFRVFTQNPSIPLTQQVWTPIGPASENGNGNSSRTTGLAVDPSDPSGNTVFIGGASGGIWKTTNFLTTDPQGPRWIPLTDNGPTFAINIGSIAVFPRNNDPNQSVVIAATGEGDTGTPGIGFLLSTDGGRTWSVLDSTMNADATGTIYPIQSANRDHLFVGASAFKVIIDPTPTPGGKLVMYAALSNGKPGASGVWRSNDGGLSWRQIQSGNATDVALAAGSAGANGNLQVLYAAIRGQGVFFTAGAPGAASMLLTSGLAQNPQFRDGDVPATPQIPINPSTTPNGAKGRISLVAPALVVGDRIKNLNYEGWLYALVAGANDLFDGLYMTKDFGANWTRVYLPELRTPFNGGFGTNNVNAPQHDPFGSPPKFAQGNYDQAIAIDPQNPNVVYIGGTNDGTRQPLGGFIRVDTTLLEDSQNLSAYSNQRPDGGTVQFTQGSGSVLIKPVTNTTGPGKPYGFFSPSVNTGYINFYRNPFNPFASNSDSFFTNIARIQNTGFGATYAPFSAEVDTDVHRIITMIDPLTGKTRLIVGDDQGVASSVDNGDGTLNTGIGFAPTPNAGGVAIRNGNLQTAQFYYGATQPSQLAADIAGSMFYGMAQDNGFPASPSNPLQTGQIGWSGSLGDGTGVATDQTGSGTTYMYKWPCCGPATAQTFFEVNDPRTGVSGRTTGLLQNQTQFGGVTDDPSNNVGQWGFVGGANFAVNPVDNKGIIISAPGNNAGVGRLFRTTDQGLNWFPIGQPNNFTGPGGGTFGALGQYGATLDGTYAPAVSFGAPNSDASSTGLLDDFIYAGTSGGRIFVSRTGGAPWLNISRGLDGSGVAQIVTDPKRGSTDAFAVTANGVYYKADAFDTSTPWQNISGNLFQLTQPVFGNAADQNPTLQYLTSIAADWRYAVPVAPGDPASPTFPVLYVGGEGGVFRSLDFGATWTYFPAASTYVDPATNISYNLPDGGYLPNAHVTSLNLALGNIDPNTGLPVQSGGLNLLVASTFGRGSFGIRLGDAVPQFNVQAQPGPRVIGLANPNPVGGPSTEIDVQWSGPVDPQTFTPATVRLLDPNGVVINNISVTEIPDINAQGADLRDKFAITFPSQSVVGAYSLTIGYNPNGSNIPTITDPAGNLMNQDGDAVNGQAVVDQYHTTVTLNSTTNNHLSVTSFPTTATAGTPVSVTIKALDGSNSLLSAFRGTVTLTAAPGTGTFTPVTAQLVNGVATIPNLVFHTAGAETVLVTFTPTPPSTQLNGTSWTTLVSAAAASQFAFDQSTYVVNAPASQSFTLTAEDRFGNPTGYTGPVSITSTGAAATLPGSVTMTNGVATFSGQFAVAGSVHLTATGPDLTTPSNPPLTGSATVSVSPGPATQIVVTPAAGSFAAGNPVPVTVQALDANGNPANNLDGQPLTITVQPGGTSTVAPATVVFANGVANITVTFIEAGTFTVTATQGTLTGTSSPITVVTGVVPNPTPTVLPSIFAVGTGPAGSPVLQVFNQTGAATFTAVPFPAGYHGLVDPASVGFTGGLRVAVGDVTGDGVPDYVVGTGPGITASVVVIDGATGKTILDYQPFGSFTGGVFVAVGDIHKKGFDDIVITPDEGGGPRVEILSGKTFALSANFFGIDDPNFRGGARAAVGDVNGDGFADLVVSAGFGGGPRISYYDGAHLAKGVLYHPISDFFAFEPALRNGAYVTIGDVNGDGYGDLIFGAGPGGGPRVLVISGQTLLSTSPTAALNTPIANFFAGDLNNRGGIRVTAKNLNGDQFADVVTGSGTDGGATVTAYSGKNLVDGDFLDPLFSFDAQPGYLGGVYVG